MRKSEDYLTATEPGIQIQRWTLRYSFIEKDRHEMYASCDDKIMIQESLREGWKG